MVASEGFLIRVPPIIERNGGGHILNVHSALSWLADGTPYSASKAALWSQTNSLRLELRPRGITLTGLHVAYVDTDMTAGVDAPKSDPRDVAVAALEGIEAKAHEVRRTTSHAGSSRSCPPIRKTCTRS